IGSRTASPGVGRCRARRARATSSDRARPLPLPPRPRALGGRGGVLLLRGRARRLRRPRRGARGRRGRGHLSPLLRARDGRGRAPAIGAMPAPYRGVLFDLFGTLVGFEAGRLPELEVDGVRHRTTVGGLGPALAEWVPGVALADFALALLAVSDELARARAVD